MIVTVELRSLCGTNPRTDSFIFIGLSESACDIHLNTTWTDQLCRFLLLFVCLFFVFFICFVSVLLEGGGLRGWVCVCVCILFVLVLRFFACLFVFSLIFLVVS